MFQKFIDFLQRLAPALNSYNTTSIRIYATIVLAFLTAVRYLFLKGMFGEVSEPIFNSWLIFLSVLGGLDVTQYIGKRRTHIPEATSDSTTTTKEILIRREASDHKGVEPSL